MTRSAVWQANGRGEEILGTIEEDISKYLLACILTLALITILPDGIGMNGSLYWFGTMLLGRCFLWYAWQLFHKQNLWPAMPVFGYSIVSLFGIFALLMIDHCS